jgi:hypothetical protein
VALELLLAYALCLVVPSVGTLAAVLALSRPQRGVFTTTQTERNLFGDERYRFRSRWHRRAFGALSVCIFLTLFLLTLFVVDAVLIG